MKKTRKLAIILVALVMVLSIVLVACTDEPTHDYTVKVVGPDGAPYTSALVQPCLVAADGELDMCYEGVETNDQGIAYLDIGKEIPTEDANEIEIHLLGLPSTLTYQPVRMKKGETKTITLTKVQNSGPNLKTPISGTGTGSYEKDEETEEPTNSIDLATFDPYVVGEGSYLLKFDSAEQKIFYAFKADEGGKYKVYSTGDVDAAVIQLIGSRDYGLSCWPGEGFDNDNVSATDHNFYYEFEVDESAVQNGVYTYFEVSLSNPADVGKEAVITFKYASEGQGGELTDVYPSSQLNEYKLIGEYVDAPIDGTCKYVMGEDGYYHLNDANGPVLVATLGTDKDVNKKHAGNDVSPRGLELGFTKIVAQGANLTIYDGDHAYNYIPMVTAYTAASNSEGRYPLTDELITFLNGYLVKSYGLDWFEENSGIDLPEKDPWLVWCGYYQDPYEEEVGGGEDEADGSDEENAIMLEMDVNTVNVPEGGKVYYAFYARSSFTLIIRPRTENIKLTVYSEASGSAGATPLEQTEDSNGLFCYQIAMEERQKYYFVFATLDGAAEEYQVVVEEATTEGTSENPMAAYQGANYGETTKKDGMDIESIFYSYTVTEDDAKLYFYEGDNAVIRNIYYFDNDFVPHYMNIENMAEGYAFEVGTVVYIEVSTVEIGGFQFGLYNAPLGSAENPIVLFTGENTINLPAGKMVYYSYMSWVDGTLTIRPYTLTPSNLVIKVYIAGSDLSSATTLELTDDDGLMYYELEVSFDTTYVLVISTVDGSADSFDINIEEPPYDEGDEEGTASNPKEIYFLSQDMDYCDELDNSFQEVYYTYTVASYVEKLFFDWEDNTMLVVTIGEHDYFVTDETDAAALRAGIEVDPDTVVTIIVSLYNAESGTTSFKVYASYND